MDTTTPFFVRAEVAHRHEQARERFRDVRRRRARRDRRQRAAPAPEPGDSLW